MKNPFNLFILNQKWSKRFLASHLFGWATAFFQTFWIVIEIRIAAKKILEKMGQQNG